MSTFAISLAGLSDVYKRQDMILAMRNGTIVEQGTHEQLLIRKGVYAELYNSQFVPQTP